MILNAVKIKKLKILISFVNLLNEFFNKNSEKIIGNKINL